MLGSAAVSLMTESEPKLPARHRAAAGPGDAGERLDRFLAASVAAKSPEISRSQVKALIEAGHARAGAATITEPSHRVKPGGVYELDLPAPVSAAPLPQAMALTIVYEDEHLIVIDKPAGMVVHPAPGNPDRTLVNALLAHCGEGLSGIGGVRRPGIVHRLDKDTSGLLVAAKTQAAMAGLAPQFADHSIERVYTALVWGLPEPATGEIGGAIGRHPIQRKKMAVREKGGKAALTRYRRVRAIHGVISVIECRLLSGRTHQIRVHLAHKGNPVVGDPVYGRARAPLLKALPAAAQAAIAGFKRQALHAATLGFRHPATGARLSFASPLPPDMAALLAALDGAQAATS
jgi:23S rRNA pseudouridine1911/1915/1917 synthase